MQTYRNNGNIIYIKIEGESNRESLVTKSNQTVSSVTFPHKRPCYSTKATRTQRCRVLPKIHKMKHFLSELLSCYGNMSLSVTFRMHVEFYFLFKENTTNNTFQTHNLVTFLLIILFVVDLWISCVHTNARHQTVQGGWYSVE